MKNATVNKYQLQFGKEGSVVSYIGVGKQLHDKATTVRIHGDNICYFCSIGYLLKGSQDQHLALRQSLCDYTAAKKSQIPTAIHPS